jgi:hypothetical protein
MRPHVVSAAEHGGLYIDGRDSRGLRLSLTVDGLRQLIHDQIKLGFKPSCILVSETDRRDLNQDLMSMSATPVAKADENLDFESIGFIEGCMVASHPDVRAGHVRIIDAPAA